MPPAVEVMAERAGSYLAEAVLLGDVFGFEDDVFHWGLGYWVLGVGCWVLGVGCWVLVQ